jgi:membrane associated rhomboid family serine protease
MPVELMYRTGKIYDRLRTMNALNRIKDFRLTINIRLFLLYLAIVLIIPAISTTFEYLISINPGLRSELQLDMQNFHIYQIFTTSFVHLNFDHFLANVTAYLLIAIYGLVLATFINRKRLYVVLNKVIVIIFLIFGACFAIFNATTSYYVGLSGIDSALAGLLLIFWLVYLEYMSQKRMRTYYGLVLCCVLALSAGIIARYIILYHSYHNVPLLAALSAVIGILVIVAFLYRHQFSGLYDVMQRFSWSARLITIAIVLIFAYFIWNLFPEQLGNYSTRDVSISLHIAGIVIGILAGYIFLVYLERIAYFNGEKAVITEKIPGQEP